jgi:NAD(P)-dependent dehydrogenase (short-subunit alcohol dehydrogenase family)
VEVPSSRTTPAVAAYDLVERVQAAAELLEEIARDRGLLARLPDELRRRFLTAAGRVSRPERDELRSMAKAFRRNDRKERRQADDAILEATGIRSARKAPVFVTPPPLLAGVPIANEPAPAGELREPRKCYVCKTEFRTVHAFYDQMCSPCGDLNLRKRHQTADLRGRVAIVTGARVKIGYHAAIKLLRAGCHVVVTTRFPRDAAARYAREVDFEDFRDRLEIHGLDLRHTPSVEAFAAHLGRTLGRLDFLLNNACQTVRRPPGFYRHLVEAELAGDLPPAAKALLASWEALRGAPSAPALPGKTPTNAGLIAPVELSQLPLLAEDLREEIALFPEGRLDADLQQVDLRGRNSWRLTLAEVSSVELLEVQLVNAIAPFVLNARLKPLMMRVPTADKHIVNVSAMEGQFYRAWKTDRHPHTNMAKAALNMMTRTSAADYVKDGIHMNSVDTGWITDEDPIEVAARKVDEHGFSPPLDVVDGAARIVDPIFDGFLTGEHRWGAFLKDYAETPW